jgi:hypothetical protein
VAVTEQSMHPTMTARATTARLGLTTAARLDSTAAAWLLHRARRFFRGATTARLGCTAAFAAATALAAKQLESVGLAFQHDRRTNERCHANGGTQHKVLTHGKSSKRNQKQILNGNRSRSHNAAECHQKRVGRSGGGPRPSFLDLFKKRLPTEDGRLGREVGSENLPIK